MVATPVTVTTLVPDLLLPSVEVAEIVAIPDEMPVTKPLLFTRATVGSLVVQFSILFEALDGNTVAGSNAEAPVFKFKVGGKVTELTSMVPNGDKTEPGITSEGTVPDCPGFNHPTARLSCPVASFMRASM